MNKNKFRKGAASLAAVLVASVGLATAANAAPGDGRLMPTETEGSLTIHKYDGDPTGGNNSGVELSESDIPDLDPLDNAGFSVWRLTCPVTDDDTTTETLDLKTNKGWELTSQIFQVVGSNPTQADLTEAANTVTGSTTCALVQFGLEQLTGADGNASGVTVFNSMPLGVYYVSETTTPDGFKSVLPFLVTVPMTNPDNTAAWMYDINVYPKDRPEATKTVNDEEVSSTEDGTDLVAWTITSPAPANSNGTAGFYMVDNLDSRLTFNANIDVTITQPDGTVIDPALVNGTDYNIYVYTIEGTAPAPDSQQVFMELTETGLTALDAAVASNPNAYVNWSFTTSVSGTGPIENDATIFDNNPSGGQTGEPCTDEPCTPTPPTTPPPTVPECEPDDPSCTETPKVTTKFGAVKLTKIANTQENGNNVPLAGAEFKVLASSSDDVCTAGVETGLSGTTNASGELYLQQLRVSDWANGAQLTITDDDDGNPVIPAGWMYYCLIETKAPTGYELLPEGIPFQLISAGTDANTNNIVDDSVEPSVTYQFAWATNVQNVPSKGGFQLPLTGGIGTLFLVIIGAGVLGGTFAYARKQNKKAQAAN